MRIFIAGATGVIGSRVLRLLADAGHDVMGMTRAPERADGIRALGATPLVCDVFDAERLAAAVAGFAPDVVMHQLTDLPDDAAQIAARLPANARIRREGTRNLIDAARAAGAPRFLAQSVAWKLDGEGGAAVRALEESVLAVGGVVLRYGQFYGPGTYHEDDVPPHPRVHVDAAAERTVDALDAPSGVVVIAE